MSICIGGVFRNAAATTPDSLAVTLDDDALTFREMDTQSNRVANALAGAGVERGDRVCWWGDTSLDAVPLFAALAKLGAVFAPLNARASVDEITPVVEYARPRLLVAGRSHAEPAGAVARDLGIPLAQVGPGPGADLETAAAAASAADPRPAVPEDQAHVIFFTSGSTGRPKGVVLSHRANWLRTYPGATSSAGGGGTVCMFPLFHMAGWTIALGAWQARRAVHFVRVPDAPTLLSETERHRAARLYCIPAVWARILEHGLGAFDLSTLVEADTGTSATPPELLRALHEALPHTVTRVFYGSTEAGPGLQLGPRDLVRKPGSVGVPQPGVEVRLVDGEVCLRSPFLMDGYFDNPTATAEVLRDGWYHTGDLGAFDEERYVSIVGRARDVIRTGGETVAPAEVETVLSAHPAIAEVAVVGVPDPAWGETVTAVVVLSDGAVAVDVGALRAHCEGRLSPFKHPRRVEIVDALPRTAATGQVQRTLIVEQLLARLS
ncbi:MAG: fatty-acyl-CoA synthase [Actinomycetota bacterium]|nr:fatty-acyl-CoA synthase [Actinomycetota bacterium]